MPSAAVIFLRTLKSISKAGWGRRAIHTRTLLRGCLKSPDSVKFGDYTRSFQLPNTWAESYARTLSVEISGLFKHPLRARIACIGCCIVKEFVVLLNAAR